MKRSLKTFFYLACGLAVLSLAGCSSGANTPSSAAEVKSFRGGGPMSAEDKAYEKKLMQGAQPPAGAPAAGTAPTGAPAAGAPAGAPAGASR